MACATTSAAASFTTDQIAALAAPLDRAHVRSRRQGGSSVSYIEGWVAIAEANRIFGFGGWQRETIELTCVSQAERPIGRDQRPGWGVTYTARVRITVAAGDSTPVIREGCGAGHGIDVDLGQAHESALKEAETDAMKRALMTFGNPFGLALYDKEQRQVSGGGSRVAAPASGSIRVPGNGTNGHRPSPAARRESRDAQPERAPASPPAAALDDPALAPLDPPTIQRLHATLRGLPRPALEGFTKAFRKRFQVPGEAVSIADRITQKRHHDWIEAWLVQHRSVA
jgi:DNA recombination protein Rad52